MDDDRTARLLARLRDEGDAEAWPDFLEAAAPLLLQAVRAAVRDAEDAGDAFVFVCERLAAHRCARLRRFDAGGEASFPTWLRVVAANLARDWRRQRYGRPRAFRVLRRLPALHQALFRARYQLGLTASEAQGFLTTGPASATAAEWSAAEDDIERRLTWRHRLTLATRPAVTRPESVEALAEVGHEPADREDARPDAVFYRHRRAEEVRRAVAALPAADRLLVRLRFERGLTLSEVARAAGLGDAQRADRRLRDITIRLRALLEDPGRPPAKKRRSGSV